MFIKERYTILKTGVLLLISLIFTLSCSSHFFFWDTISQISIPANWYFDNNFRKLFLPDDLATGHPPFVAMYLAITWKIFGRSLLISHLAFWPFIFGFLYQINRYIEKSGTGKVSWLVLVLVILDATLISQLSLITFDTVQLFFFIWAANSVVSRKPVSLAIAFTGLCMTSLRGVLCGGGIILFNIIFDYSESRKVSIKSMMQYLPGIAAMIIFFLTFYLEKHWIIHNINSGKWSQSSEYAPFTEILRNIGIIGWRLIDYGRICLWVVFVYILIKALKTRTLFDHFFRNTLFIAVSQLIIFTPFLVFSRNFIGHRYLLPVIIPVAICTIYWSFKYSKKPLLAGILILTGLTGGYSLIYPKTISQGWDATPAHWPYYKLRNEMIAIMKEDSIPVQNTGSFFPNLASFYLTDLSDNRESFKEADISKDNYILFSNVFNLSDSDIQELFSGERWREIKRVEKEVFTSYCFNA